VGRFAGVYDQALAALQEFWHAEALIPSAIITPVLVALLLRSPAASPPVRWIWRNGRLILLAAVGLDTLICARALVSHALMESEFMQAAAGACVDAYFFAYFSLSRRAKDSFAEFP
jgi:hypothetical protein